MRKLTTIAALFLIAIVVACGGTEAKDEDDKPSTGSSAGQSGGVIARSEGVTGQAVQGQAMSGVTVSGSGEAKAKPDGVMMRLTIGSGDMGSFDGSIPSLDLIDEEELEPVVAALKKEGVSGDDISLNTFATSPYGLGSAAAQITFRWDKPAELKSLLETIQDAVRRETDYGLQNVEALFTVKDCEPLEDQARKAALEDAARQAKSLAETADLSLGSITAVAEVPSTSFGYAVASGCAALREIPPLDSFLTVQDNSPSEVTVTSDLQVTYAIR